MDKDSIFYNWLNRYNNFFLICFILASVLVVGLLLSGSILPLASVEAQEISDTEKTVYLIDEMDEEKKDTIKKAIETDGVVKTNYDASVFDRQIVEHNNNLYEITAQANGVAVFLSVMVSMVSMCLVWVKITQNI